MRRSVVVAFLLAVTAAAQAQEIDEAVISPRFEYEPDWGTKGSFSAYATGAVEGGYYYMLSTNTYLNVSHPTALPNGECRYYDEVLQEDHRIGEQVVGYRGSNTFSFFQSTNPAFTKFRTVSPCFDGSFGEQTEQQHRTWAYGAGPTIASTAKSKVYHIVNRTRLRLRPDSTSPYELASNGAEWLSGDFDQIFIGAKQTLDAAVTTTTSSSKQCRGQANAPASEKCTSAFAWKLTPIVTITENLVDPVDGQMKTFSALPPVVAEVNSTMANLPIFSGIAAQGAVLFGFMEFGHICQAWDTSQSPPVCTQVGFPSRLAAVYITDSSTTVRPTAARLYFKKGSSWIPMNANGTFPNVPDDYAGVLNVSSISDIKFNPINSTWNLWTDEWFPVDSTTPGCEHTELNPNSKSNPNFGARLVRVNLSSYGKTTFWPSRNEVGRNNALAHYVFAPACNCLREFIFYTSTDHVCYNYPSRYDGSLRGWEVVVRRWLDGAPSQ
jgi:hypothetical protein